MPPAGGRAAWERAQERADRAVRRGVARALAGTTLADRALQHVRQGMRDRLRASARRHLGLGTRDPLPRGAETLIAREVERELGATRRERVRTTVRAVASSIRAATGADAAQVSSLFGPRAERFLTMEVTERTASTLAQRLTHNRDLAVGGIPLSRRVHAMDTATRNAMHASVQDSLRAGRSVRASAERLLLVEDQRLAVHLPRYVTELRDAVRAGASTEELREVVRTHARSIRRLTDSPNGLRQSARIFAADAVEATASSIQRHVDHFIFDKARFLEQRIVRTEGQRALAEAFRASTREHPWTMGFRWNLAGGHPHEDICDVFAGQDSEGLGEGGYSDANVPDCPAHPHCMCFLTSIVDDQYEDREAARAAGTAEPDRPWESGRVERASDWLARQPADRRRRILGAGRDDLFDTHPERVVAPNGTLRPLWQAEQRARPSAPSLGERARLAPESRMRLELRQEQQDATQREQDARTERRVAEIEGVVRRR